MLDIAGILDTIQSHAAASGLFDQAVGTHTPTNAPGNGLTCSITVAHLAPIPASGLGSASARLEFSIRLATPALQEPKDAIDTSLVTAVDTLFTAYAADFELGGEDGVRSVDVFGAHGAGLSGTAGYMNQDGQLYRIWLLTLPVICNDLWEESP